MATQVHVYLQGINAVHQRFYLTRKQPASLEEAFAIVLHEDYSVLAARPQPKHAARSENEPEPMDIDVVVAAVGSLQMRQK